MKRLFSILMLLALSMPMFAQKDVTKFLGIPVDGSKSEMIRKLKAKGFTEISYSDMLRGEFNGKNVNVKVVTNNNKVYRIFVVDAYPVSETDIKINFNKLYRQFEDNKNYISPSDLSISDKDEREIPESEDISYEMTVNNKRYEAGFLQLPDSVTTSENIKSILLSKYTQEQVDNPTNAERKEIAELISNYTRDVFAKKSVWFMIDKDGIDYRILLYYDNEYNEANGEDL